MERVSVVAAKDVNGRQARDDRWRRLPHLVCATALCLTAVTLPALAEDKAQDKTYPSDSFTGEGFVSMLSGWDAITKNRPDIIAENLRKVIAVNQDATHDERKQALIDQYDDMAGTIGEGLGHRLGEIYLKGYKDGALPKTKALLNKESGRAAGKNASSNPSKNHFDFPRPYLVTDRIFRFDNPEGDAYASTSGSFPSGHTSQAYWQGTLLATMVPERFDEILARTAQASHNRLVMGVHYPLDVVGGRMMGQRIAAYRWNDAEFRPLLTEAASEIRTYLEAQCGASLETCIETDIPYLSDAEAARRYDERMTYGFKPMGKTDRDMVVPSGAENLLSTRFPYLSDDQRKEVLKTTALASGYPLDIAGDEGGWQRLNLSAAGRGYGAFNGAVTVTLDAARADGKTPGAAFNAKDVWTNDIGGEGALTKSGDGALTLAGNNSFGGLTLQGGTLELSGVNQLKGVVSIEQGLLTSQASLTAETVAVAKNSALDVAGALKADTMIEGSLTARSAHLLGDTAMKPGSRLVLTLGSASLPAVALEGSAAKLELAGDLSILLPADARLCAGMQFNAITVSHGGTLTGKPAALQPSPVLQAKSMAYDAEVKDDRLVITLTGKSDAGCK